MTRQLIVVVALALSAGRLSAQARPIIVVKSFTAAQGVELPYDLKQIQGQMVAELRVMLSKQFEIVPEAPAGPQSAVYTLDGEIRGWRAGNAAKRLVVGLGSGRESSDIAYRVTDASGKKVLDEQDTIRTNFYSQGAGSTGTLAHPIAQKIADRIKDAKLK
jgi:Domain of unknown function (DUF4410)